MNTTSPLEYLAAFATCFVAGATSVLAFQRYMKRIRAERQGELP